MSSFLAEAREVCATLFASYYEEHHDSAQLRFSGGCTTYGHTYVGPQLHVLIAKDGHQANSA